MNSNELFSFLDQPQDAADDDMDVQELDSTLQVDSSKKRKASSPISAAAKNGRSSSPDVELVPSSSKKKRIASPKPVVVDEVEIEAKREVAASAGLTGAVEAGSRLELRHQVRHQVAVPPGFDYIPIANHVPPAKPAREYKFTLDPFQEVSVHAIQRNESVLVSAHTSAGKTVVAEYAIAQCLQNKQRVIYTSPIKALSNQKYREMLAEFGDVGLMTGDVTINPSATCLVMTTEILRSMLYRGSEIMREVAWVIFDEIHYMRDKERGVVWEETIILLPHTVRYVFLSATIPNAMQFAEWICKSHEQPCHVVYTDFRPTPLQHYLFPAGGEGIYLVVNEKGEFREDNFTKAMGMLQEKQGEDPADSKSGKGKKGKTKKGGDRKGPSDIQKIVKMIMLKNYNPVIIFAFSKRECESLALTLSKLEFNSTEEQELVGNIFQNAIDNLSVDDRQLPQITNLLPLLKRGIGIHHGGLLPILKEVIEILFQEGLIKVLFATETFSIGLNMPAKTVVFTAARKFDGKEFRNLSSGEYIQMSGRAGRRGLDDRGVVIMMCDEKLEPTAAKGMVKGEADRLDSAFHLGYNMVLNLMKVEGISPEFMLEKCFFQFQSSMGVPMLEDELKREEDNKRTIVIADEESVKEYWEFRKQLDEMSSDFREVVTHPNYSLPFLQPGRLVKVKYLTLDFGWGVIINYHKRLPAKNRPTPKPDEFPPHESYVVDILLNCSRGSTLPKDRNATTSVATPGSVKPCPSGEKGEPLIVPVLLSTIEALSHLRIFLPKDLRPVQARETVWKSVLEVQRRFPDGIALLDPIENMDIKDEKFRILVKKIDTLEKKMFTSPLHKDPRLPELYTLYCRKHDCQNRIRELKKRIQSTNDVLQMEELKCRKRILRRLGFTDASDIVDMKGRVACEISTGDELLLTELIFNGVFNQMSPEHCASLLSCFVFTEKSEQVTKLKEELAAPLRVMQEIARRIAKISKESKLPLEEDEYVSSFKVELMDAVVQWCRGASFTEICKLTDQFEGSLIRVFRRLQELIRQMSQASKVIGNSELREKFDKASEMLERPNSVIHRFDGRRNVIRGASGGIVFQFGNSEDAKTAGLAMVVKLLAGLLALVIPIANASVIHVLQSHMRIPTEWITPCEYVLSRTESSYAYTPTEWIMPFSETVRGRLVSAFSEMLVRRLFGIAAVFCVSHAAPPGFPQSGNGLWYTSPATDWVTQYLPVGNGFLGATTPGGSFLESTILNIESLWSGGPFQDPSYNGGNKLPAEQGAMAAAMAQIRQTIFGSSTGTIDNIEVLATDAGDYGSNVAAAILVNEVGASGPVSNYYRWLDLDIGVHHTLWTQANATYHRELFCSHPAKACVQHLSSTTILPTTNYSFAGYSSLPPLASSCYDNNTLQIRGAAGSPGMLWEILASVQAYGNGSSVECTTVNSTTSVITVEGATEAWILWVGDTDYDMNAGDAAHQYSFRGADPHDALTSLIHASAQDGYHDLLNQHTADYSSFMTAFSLDLGQKPNLDMSTDQITHAYKRDVGDPYLEWLLFNFGRYLLASSSRGLIPANLQGGWVEDTSPWSADYHANINLQMNYWFAELTNMDVTQPLWDYMEKTWVPRGSYTAQVLYNSSGWVTHNEMNIFGHTGMKLNGNSAQWADYPASNAWMAIHVWDHFDFTNDVAWWQSQGYPLIKGVARFHLDNLNPDLRSNDTELTVVPCNSPEQTPITYSCANFQQLIWQLFNAVEKGFAAAGDTDTQFLDEVRTKRQWMDKGVRVGWWGELMEWKAGLDSASDTHRHLSHLVGLYPGYAVLGYEPSLQPVRVNGTLMNYTRTDVLNAAEVSLIHRGPGVGPDADAGWEKVWRAACWAALRNPGQFYDILSYSVFENFAENLFSIFPGSQPIFQIDANFGYVAALLSGLIQIPDTPTIDTPLTVILLPAFPVDKWATGSIKGARIRSGLLVDFSWNNGQLGAVHVRPASGTVSSPAVRQIMIVNGQTGQTINSFWSNQIHGQLTIKT